MSGPPMAVHSPRDDANPTTSTSLSRARRSVPMRRYGPVMEITQIGPADWERFRAVRLASLSESPAAFGSRYADWVDAPAERWQSRLTQVPLTLLAHETTEVVGVASGQPVGEIGLN
jgi:hypothetical protein